MRKAKLRYDWSITCSCDHHGLLDDGLSSEREPPALVDSSPWMVERSQRLANMAGQLRNTYQLDLQHKQDLATYVYRTDHTEFVTAVQRSCDGG